VSGLKTKREGAAWDRFFAAALSGLCAQEPRNIDRKDNSNPLVGEDIVSLSAQFADAGIKARKERGMS